MSGWPTIGAHANRIMQNKFGEPVVYQAMQGGQASGSPATITIIRRIRERAESGAVASVEEIEVNPVDLASPSQRGDTVAAWGAQFTVTTVRQPDPYGMVHLTLTLQPQ
jgi:hypothetical protein